MKHAVCSQYIISVTLVNFKIAEQMGLYELLHVSYFLFHQGICDKKKTT
jgi:hypothetical protein